MAERSEVKKCESRGIEGGASGVGAEIPLQPVKRTRVTTFHDLQPV